MLKDLLYSESGQGLTEYALILSFVVLLVITALKGVGSQLVTWYQWIVSQWPK